MTDKLEEIQKFLDGLPEILEEGIDIQTQIEYINDSHTFERGELTEDETVIETGIKRCNELGNFVLEHYYVTNQGIPEQSEIGDIIEIVRK